jgi:hypothetical protein
VEQAATGIVSSWLAQLGIFGLGLTVIGLFVWLWIRESRAVLADTETIIARKDKEIAELTKQRDEAIAQQRKTYSELMACLYPKNGGTG